MEDTRAHLAVDLEWLSDDDASILCGEPVTNPLHILSSKPDPLSSEGPAKSGLQQRMVTEDKRRGVKRPASRAPSCRTDMSQVIQQLQQVDATASTSCQSTETLSHRSMSMSTSVAPRCPALARQQNSAVCAQGLPVHGADEGYRIEGESTGNEAPVQEGVADSRAATKKRHKGGCFPHGNYNRCASR